MSTCGKGPAPAERNHQEPHSAETRVVYCFDIYIVDRNFNVMNILDKMTIVLK